MLRPHRIPRAATSWRTIFPNLQPRYLHARVDNEPRLRNDTRCSSPPVPWRVPNRGAKRKTSVNLEELLGGTSSLEDATKSKPEDLPQGLLPLEPLELEEEAPALPPVLLQVRRNMSRFQNCVLLTRVGGFYELYFEHATEFGPLLNLKVAQRKTGPKTNTVFVPMSGFPFFQLDRYLKILVQDLNRYVAIAEEFRNDAEARSKAGGLMNDRKVSRIITPGTLIDENFMDPFTNNYVLAIHAERPVKDEMEHPEAESDQIISPSQLEMPVGLAWLDLSTGHFFTQSTTFGSIPSFLARIGPREIVLDEDIEKSKDHGILSILAEEHNLITYVPSSAVKPIKDWAPMLESPVSPRTVNDFAPEEVAAGSTLLQYVGERLQGSNMKLQPPVRQLDTMGIDKNTMRALEIKKTMRDDLDTGSLLHTVRRTVTKGGARLLDNWLSSPSTSPDVINSRLDLVTYLLENETFRERIVVLLRRSHDSHRLLQKFAFGRGDPDDLLGLASTIRATEELKTTLIQNTAQDECMKDMISRINLDGPSALADRIQDAIDEEGVVQQQIMEDGEVGDMQALAEAVVISEGSREDANILPKKKKKPTSIKEYYSDDSEAWIMKPAASPTLERLHKDLGELAASKQALAEDLSNRLGASSLTLRFSPGLGHICHIKGKDVKREMIEGKRVSSSRTTSSFHHPEWTSLGGRIDRCRDHIRGEEQRVFRDLREQVILNIVRLRRNAVVLDELDVASSFALLAAEKNWTRPILNRTSAHKIIGGRHPTVEGGLEKEGRGFTTNDCLVGDVERTWLITGPNMAGKSTFLRQNALITILAQVGSYVPAEYAEMGIVDQIFSRVGSADDLYRDQSTFMVEMLETAAILRHATSRSFVIMDEIGRGTTPTDGTAVAFACLHHLYHFNKCRTLFATHFHDLADMVINGDMKCVGFYCTDVEEDVDGEGFRYVHRLRQGVNRRSHALKVARLAGLPEEAINVAKGVLERKAGSV